MNDTATDSDAQFLAVLCAIIAAVVVASGRSAAELAELCRMPYTDMRASLDGRRDWSLIEVVRLSRVLGARASTWLDDAYRITDGAARE